MDFINFLNVLDINPDCSLISNELYEIIQYCFLAIRISVPLLLIVLIIKDLVSAVSAGKEDDMKKAQSNAIKRIAIAIIIFFVPTIVNLVLDISGIASTTCGIG